MQVFQHTDTLLLSCYAFDNDSYTRVIEYIETSLVGHPDTFIESFTFSCSESLIFLTQKAISCTNFTKDHYI